MRKVMAAIAAAGAAALIAACGGPSVTAGHVIAREYQPAYSYIELFPVWTTTCMSTGSSVSCYPRIAFFMPWVMYQPADWRLELKSGKLSGWTYVSEQQYDRARIGQWWGSRNDARPAAVKVSKNAVAPS